MTGSPGAMGRVLVVAADGSGIADGLAGQAHVERAGTLEEAAGSLRAQRFDVTVLCFPFADMDLIACCGALRESPAHPPLLVLDASDRPAELPLIPRSMRPHRIVAGRADGEKLWNEICEILEHGGEDPPAEEHAPGSCLAPLLIGLAEQSATGILEIKADGVITRIYLRSGKAVMAEGGPLQETLGRMLLRHGQLSDEQYVRVIERMTERVVENESVRLGEVLVELDLLSPAQVFEALSLQMEGKITGCFRWPRVSHSFEPTEGLPDGSATFDVPPVEALVLRGMKEHFDTERIAEALRPWARSRPRLRGEVGELGTAFRLGSEESRFLRRIDGSASTESLRSEPEQGSCHPEVLLAALAATGHLSLKEGPGAEEAAVSAGTRATRAALRGRQAAERKKAGGSPPGDGSREKIEAEKVYRAARALLDKEKFDLAFNEFSKAVELQPQEPEYRMYQAWAAYLASRVEARVNRAKAFACAVRMTEHDAACARAHSILGRLALDDAKHDTAEKEFEAALLRDPEDRDALRGLKLVRRGD